MMMPNSCSGRPPLVGRAADFRTYPVIELVAQRAVRRWLEDDRGLSVAHFRDRQFLEYCHDWRVALFVRQEHLIAFRRAFAQALGMILIEEGRLHAASS